MTAPDPGLTDLIAAHQAGERWTDFEYPSIFSDKPFVATTVTKMVNCSCGESMPADDHPAHVALVVEQHTNGRITALEAERDQAIAHDRQPYPTAWAYEQACAALEKHRKRADKHEATIARVEKALEAAEKSVPDDWGVTYIYTSQLRAALEGEQQ